MNKKFIVLSVLTLTACGTVFNGSSQSIHFESNVKNISIYANGALVCSQTPCQADIDRGSGALTIIAKAEGYEDNIQQIKTNINTVSWGNLSSVYSWTTDFATSSMWKYAQDGIYINMKKARKTADAGFEKLSRIRHFALHNYAILRHEAASGTNGEYLQTLKTLSGQKPTELAAVINAAPTEALLANRLTPED